MTRAPLILTPALFMTVQRNSRVLRSVVWPYRADVYSEVYSIERYKCDKLLNKHSVLVIWDAMTSI